MTLGLELTDTTVHVVCVDETGTVRARADESGAADGLPAAVGAAVTRVLTETGTTIAHVGLASPRPGDQPGDAVLRAVRDAAPNAKTTTVASGHAVAIAETWCGAARGLNTVVTFSLGEHVTSGIVIGGRVFSGAHGYAGSIGWLALNPVERDDYRRYGGLEAEVAAAGIVRRLVWRVKSGDRSSIVDQVGGDLRALTADHVFRGARVGDGVCISVVRDTARYVGMAVANLATILDPEIVVLGGTLASTGDLMLESIRIECGRRLRHSHAQGLRIVLSTLGADAAAIGAARATAMSAT